MKKTPPLTPVTELAELRSALPGIQISSEPEDLENYGADWSGVIAPKAGGVAFPRSAGQVSELLRFCNQRKIQVVPSRGRTGLSGGATASSGELVLSLEKINHIGEIDFASSTLRVGAGAITQAVHEHCRPHGLIWPVDFASKGSSQVGGNIATNAGGVHVIRYGTTRNWVLSIELVTMDGEILELNGELEKNNTGYDLRHLVIGSEGTLGVITAATLKLAPLPKEKRVCFFKASGMTRVIELLSEARKGPFEIHAFEYLGESCYGEALSFQGLSAPVPPGEGGATGAYVLLEIEPRGPLDLWEQWVEGVFARGLAEDGVMAQSPREAAELWKIREGIAESILAGKRVHQHDVSVPISRLAEFSSSIEEEYRREYPDLELFVFGHIGDGNLHIWLRKPEEMSDAEFAARCERSDRSLFEFVRGFRGSVSAEHGIGLLKRSALPYSRTPRDLALLRAIKAVFDPNALLNPGKVFEAGPWVK